MLVAGGATVYDVTGRHTAKWKWRAEFLIWVSESLIWARRGVHRIEIFGKLKVKSCLAVR